MRFLPFPLSLVLVGALVGCEGKREAPKPLKVNLPAASPSPSPEIVLFADLFRRRPVPPGTDTNVDRVETTLAENPNDLGARRAVGLAYYAAGGYEAAIRRLEGLTDPIAQLYLGLAQMALGNKEPALVALKGLGPQSKLPKNLLAVARLELGTLYFQVVKDDAAAEVCFNDAVRLGLEGEARLGLGLLRASQGKTEPARRELLQATQLLPKGKARAAAFAALGRLERDPQKARAWYDKTRDDDPENPWLQKLLQ